MQLRKLFYFFVITILLSNNVNGLNINEIYKKHFKKTETKNNLDKDFFKNKKSGKVLIDINAELNEKILEMNKKKEAKIEQIREKVLKEMQDISKKDKIDPKIKKYVEIEETVNNANGYILIKIGNGKNINIKPVHVKNNIQLSNNLSLSEGDYILVIPKIYFKPIGGVNGDKKYVDYKNTYKELIKKIAKENNVEKIYEYLTELKKIGLNLNLNELFIKLDDINFDVRVGINGQSKILTVNKINFGEYNSIYYKPTKFLNIFEDGYIYFYIPLSKDTIDKLDVLKQSTNKNGIYYNFVSRLSYHIQLKGKLNNFINLDININGIGKYFKSKIEKFGFLENDKYNNLIIVDLNKLGWVSKVYEIEVGKRPFYTVFIDLFVIIFIGFFLPFVFVKKIEYMFEKQTKQESEII